jgi:hypothetical protein
LLGPSYLSPKAVLGKNMLKIALFVYSTKPRGGVIHTLALANALHSLGHAVCVYALDKEKTGKALIIPFNVPPNSSLPTLHPLPPIN